MEFKEMEQAEIYQVMEALDEMGISFNYNSENKTFTVYGKEFKDQEEMDDHIIFIENTK